ncbi:hypothetical protein DM01DRAFT_1385119 [Hesseltinella vesiculosa]|uniref:R3H domain-containing protein n=1 Tax=Hesseltinella vesiculosa TaxID=101127 RepID=A0A1X2GAP5_9FUNG|nr:hypothetical protein DM01DRAFT_1385119 [Hesseltinella vesiculosa]
MTTRTKVIIVESTAHWEALQRERAEFNASTSPPPATVLPNQPATPAFATHRASSYTTPLSPAKSSRRKRRHDNSTFKDHPQAVLRKEDLKPPGYGSTQSSLWTALQQDSHVAAPKPDPGARAQPLPKSLRQSLKRQHIPAGSLHLYEKQLTAHLSGTEPLLTMEINDPYQRWMFHALCQYYQVDSYSKTVDGRRFTFVDNKTSLDLPTRTFMDFLHRK